MAKRKYMSPLVLDSLQPGTGPVIIIGASQGSSGYDSQWSFDGVSEDDIAMIELNCDDFDLDAMDTNDDYVITQEEFEAWYAEHGTW